MSGRDPRALRAALETRLARRAAAAGRSLSEERRRFATTRFLAAVFTNDPEGWILKGGVSMMLRLPRARHTKDVDLARADANIDEAIAQLHQALDDSTDPLQWQIDTKAALTGGRDGVRLTVTASCGGKQFEQFGIDLVAGGELVGAIDRHRIPADPDLPEFEAAAQVLHYPIADQVADKLCAMYQRFGNDLPSSRLRDLNDLLLIQAHDRIPFSDTVDALILQQHERAMTLPAALIRPDATWTARWRVEVRRFPLPDELHTLDAALARAGVCYTPLLAAVTAGGASAGHWDPDRGAW